MRKYQFIYFKYNHLNLNITEVKGLYQPYVSSYELKVVDYYYTKDL